MKKILSLILVLSIMLCAFSACSSDGTGQQMVFPIDNEPQYLDPQIVSDRGAANYELFLKTAHSLLQSQRACAIL